MKFYNLLIIISLSCSIAHAAEDKEDTMFSCGLHTSAGNPAQSDSYLCRKTYAVGYNYKHKAPDWTSFYLNSYYVNINVPMGEDKVEVDSVIPSEHRVKLFRYRKSVYVPASLLPRSSLSIDPITTQQSKLQSNTAPMMDSFYNDIWSPLLKGFKHWTINFDGDVIGYTGTYYQPSGDEDTPFDYSSAIKANIPNYFFLVAYNIKSKESIAFLLPHEKISFIDINKYRTTIDDIETLTGFKFLAFEDPEVASKTKSIVNEDWSISSVLKLD